MPIRDIRKTMTFTWRLILVPTGRFLVVVVLLIAASSGCTALYKSTQQFDSVNAKAMNDCLQLPTKSQKICHNIIAIRMMTYESFIKRNQRVLRQYRDEYNALRAEAQSAKRECSPSNRVACNEYKLARNGLIATGRFYDSELQLRRSTDQRVYSSTKALPALLKQQGTSTRVICKLRDIGRMDCVALESLLAFYDADFGSSLLNDVAKIQHVFHLDTTKEVLIDCGRGRWISQASQTQSISDLVSKENTKQAQDLCLDELISTAIKGDDFAGFSGITGVDPFDPSLAVCGMEISQGPGSDFTEQALAYAEEMRQSCEKTLAQTMMKGLTDAPLPGDKDEEGNEKEIETATEITQNGDGTETVTTVDADGNQVSETRDSTQTSDSIEVNYSDGSSGRTDFYDDGGSQTMIRDSTGAATLIVKQPTPGGDMIVTTMAPDGTVTETVEYVLELVAPGALNLEAILKSTCAGGEPCSSCIEFIDSFSDMTGACKPGARQNAKECASFSQAAECCSNPNAYPGDPRITLPNPNGDFVCMGGESPDVRSQECQQFCSVAEHQDCYATCMSSSPSSALDRAPYGDFSLLDGICIYALSEDCFSTSGFPVPGRGGPMPDLGPQPFPSTVGKPILPPVIFKHVLVPFGDMGYLSRAGIGEVR